MKKRKIVAYIRLATVKKTWVYATKEELLSQFFESTKFANPDLEIEDFYVDEYNCYSKRNPQTALCRLMQDCQKGDIGLILIPTCRNMTIDSNTTMQYVKEFAELPRPVGIYFEYENIFTLNPKAKQELTEALSYWDYHHKLKSKQSSIRSNARYNQVAKDYVLDISAIQDLI